MLTQGHNKGITSLAISDKTMFTGSYEGRVCSWTQDAGTATVVTGNCHTNQVLGLTENSGKIYSTGLDDSFRQLSVKDKTYENAFVAMGAVPKGLAVQKNLAALAAGDNVILVVDGVKTVHKQKFTPTATAIDPSCQTVAVGAEVAESHSGRQRQTIYSIWI